MSRKFGPEVGREIARDCLAVRIRMLNRILTGVYDEALRPLGVTTSQANILTAVQQLGPLSQSELAKTLELEKSTLSRNLAIMKKRGWVRTQPGEDERRHELLVTRKGLNLLEKAFPAWREAQKRAEGILGEDGVSAIKAVADKYLPVPSD